ncbi:PP2C family protein-serine/threonine phosphatase [Streptomyces formicae]|uniref:PP2C family protein-serine/threonine phosphatase n=1 Tax=Streptomyces formicae TaxID=1616117 RepID=UPI00131DDD99|nr:PP2C family protein-serine/threonine phosphatase [Streptomyces formicae]
MTSRTGWLWLTAFVGIGIAVGDVATGAATSLIGLLLVCPLLASTQHGWRVTAAVSGAATLLAVAIGTVEHALGQGDTQVRLLTLVVAGVYGTWCAHRSTSLQQQLEKVAVAAQRAIIQPTDFCIGGLEVSARYHSAAAQAHIGGDLYAFANTPMGLRLLIGDVRGKGLPPVHLSAAAIGHFRDAAYTMPDLLDVVRELETRLAGDLGAEDFITVVVAEVDPHHVRLVNCGHHAPLHLPATGAPALLTPPVPTTPIGLAPAPTVQEIPLAAGDRLLFYTDGLAEARDRTGSMPDLQVIGQLCTEARLDGALDTVLTALDHHTRHSATGDDIALILLQPAHDHARRAPHPREVRAFGADGATRRAAGTG